MENTDSQELNDLFDSVASEYNADKTVAPVSHASTNSQTFEGDCPELEALFEASKQQTLDHTLDQMETLIQEVIDNPTPENIESAYDRADALYQDVGKLAREFHNGLHELGYDRAITQAVSEVMPDTRERLKYIATLTEQAAERVLSVLDDIKPTVDDHMANSEYLSDQWDALYNGDLTIEEFKVLAAKTRDHFRASRSVGKAADKAFTDIMMAQDFQDLTGQVIKKIMSLVEDMEHNLAKILVAHQPQTVMADTSGLENGPVIDATRTDVVNSQAEVDDLLAQLGF